MQRISRINLSLAATTLVVFALASASPVLADDIAVGTTLENMQAAYNGESNAHARYIAFARKADEEGFLGVASLFRAAASAEETHAKNHAEIIKGLGGTPKAELEEPKVLSTSENLSAAIAGESYERDTMYPAFVKQARADGDKKATRSLNYALSAEAEHAALYQAALDNLDTWKTAARTFYVCPKCGQTVSALDFAKCSVCNTKKEEFLAVS